MFEPTRNEKADITTTQGQISTPHKRKELIISNSATAAQIAAGHLYLTISLGAPALDAAGIVLLPGGTYSAPEKGIIEDAIYAVATGGTGRLSIFER